MKSLSAFILALTGLNAHAIKPTPSAKNKYEKKMTDEELKKKLTPLQYKVTQKNGTEPPFKNKYWDNKRPGIYVDIISGEPLFSSTHKFKSNTGWPSFSKPLSRTNIIYKKDKGLLRTRTEVRSLNADSHLGHLFKDGPILPDRNRYCINSAALRFIPSENLEKEGYGQYAPLFKKTNQTDTKTYEAIFAGGCFWCMESEFEKLEGVSEVISGFTGGHKKDPSYKAVSGGGTGHIESIKIIYDPIKISYKKLLDFFWKNIDPTDGGGQFADRGHQYSSAIFYKTDEEKILAEKSSKELEKKGLFKKKIVTSLRKAEHFYPAENYHQDYYKKNPIRYKLYRHRSGRDRFLKNIWGTKALGENESKK